MIHEWTFIIASAVFREECHQFYDKYHNLDDEHPRYKSGVKPKTIDLMSAFHVEICIQSSLCTKFINIY